MNKVLKYLREFFMNADICPVCSKPVDIQNGYINYFPYKVHSGKCSYEYHTQGLREMKEQTLKRINRS